MRFRNGLFEINVSDQHVIVEWGEDGYLQIATADIGLVFFLIALLVLVFLRG